MKRGFLKKGSVLWLIVLIGALLLFGCDSTLLGKDDSNDGTNGGTTGGTTGGAADSVAGIWLKVFSSPYFDYDGPASSAVAEAMIMDIQGTAYTLIFYYNVEQVGGNRGTLTLSDGKLQLAVADEWNSSNYWVQAAPNTKLEFPYTISGDTLTLTVGSEQIPLTKTTFTQPNAFVGTWKAGPQTMVFYADGTFTFSDAAYIPPRTESGNWDASGTTSGYLRKVSTKINGNNAYEGALAPYTVIDSNNIEITFKTIPETKGIATRQ